MSKSTYLVEFELITTQYIKNLYSLYLHTVGDLCSESVADIFREDLWTISGKGHRVVALVHIDFELNYKSGTNRCAVTSLPPHPERCKDWLLWATPSSGQLTTKDCSFHQLWLPASERTLLTPIAIAEVFPAIILPTRLRT